MAPAASQKGARICIFLLAGCKLESIFLNVAAVNTHRDRPQVPMASLLGRPQVLGRGGVCPNSTIQGQALLGPLPQ